MTYHDVSVGLPSLLLACEMFLFALLVLYAFSASPYKMTSVARSMGASRALIEALDVRDLLSAFVRGPMRLVRSQKKAASKDEAARTVDRSQYENLEMAN